MKEISYVAPDMKIVTLQVQSIICESTFGDANDAGSVIQQGNGNVYNY